MVALQIASQLFEQRCSWVLHHSIAAASAAAVVASLPFVAAAAVVAVAPPALAFGKLGAGGLLDSVGSL